MERAWITEIVPGEDRTGVWEARGRSLALHRNTRAQAAQMSTVAPDLPTSGPTKRTAEGESHLADLLDLGVTGGSPNPRVRR